VHLRHVAERDAGPPPARLNMIRPAGGATFLLSSSVLACCRIFDRRSAVRGAGVIEVRARSALPPPRGRRASLYRPFRSRLESEAVCFSVAPPLRVHVAPRPLPSTEWASFWRRLPTRSGLPCYTLYNAAARPAFDSTTADADTCFPAHRWLPAVVLCWFATVRQRALNASIIPYLRL
jgi:hypothetical protein